MRTAGIDFGLGRVVLCSLPLTGEGTTGLRFSEMLLPMNAKDDISLRLRALTHATREAFTTNPDIVSTCVEEPGMGGVHRSQLKIYAAFGAVVAGVPSYSTVCSMMSSEWRRILTLPQQKARAHAAFRERGLLLDEWDEHHVDALCVAAAWRDLQLAGAE